MPRSRTSTTPAAPVASFRSEPAPSCSRSAPPEQASATCNSAAAIRSIRARADWPILVGNFLFKTATGVSPFDVPIITLDDPNGQFLSGTPKRLATGTGFYSMQPSITVLLPTAPGVLFANLQYVHNLGRTQKIQDRAGGPANPVKLQPGDSPSITFGIGFALNDRSALTLSYQQTHVFAAFANGQESRDRHILTAHSISGSAIRFRSR